MATQTRGSLVDIFDHTVDKIMSDVDKGNNYPNFHEVVFNVENTTDDYEKRSQYSGLGNMPIKNEGVAMQYDSEEQGYDRTVTPVTYALGVRMTREAFDDIRQGSKQKLRTFVNKVKALKQSHWSTVQTEAAKIFNLAFATNTYADGKNLCATDHPIPKTGGTFANELATPADLSYSSLTTVIQAFRDMVNLAGQPMNILPAILYVPTDLEVYANELIKSKLKVDTNNNNINAISDLWKIRVEVNPFLTDADAWFVLSPKQQHELTMLQRQALTTERGGDFDTWDIKWGAFARFKFDAWDWRGIAGSAGAA